MKGGALAGALAALVLGAPALARAETPPAFTWLPGAARTIVRTTSASRDTPLFEYAYGPRAQASIGAEFGLLTASRAAFTAHLGMYAMLALENATSEKAFPPAELWRGLVGISASIAADELARRILGRGSALELSLVLGHESDHALAFHQDPGPFDIPSGGGGNFLAPDMAARLPVGMGGDVTLRLQDRIYVNGALTQAPGADLVLRVRPLPWAQPTLALFGEHLFPHDPEARSSFFARALLGVALPGRVGEVTPFLSGDVGSGKGLLINRHEARFSFGVRYAAF
jgi:hypothetical protein